MQSNHKHYEKISTKKILFVVLLNFTITLTEFIGGLFSKSLSLLSDSLHNLSDTIAILLTYVANIISQKPKNIKKNFGYKRAEVIAAFINSFVLTIISTGLIIEALKRLYKPEKIDTSTMLIIASIGLIANFTSVIFLAKDSSYNINIKSSYLHLLSDTLSSIAVIIGSLIIKFFNIFWVDPLLTIIIALYIIKESFEIIKKTINILMQSSANLDYEAIKKDIESIDGVNNLHNMHCWLINENTIYFDAHIDIDNMMLIEVEKIYEKIEKILKEKYEISNITIQAEVNKCDNKNLIKT